MTRCRRIFATLLFVMLATTPVTIRRAWAQLDHAHELGKRVKCICNGCEQTAGTCYHVGGAFSGPCGTAKTMLKEIQEHLDKGLTDEQVIQAMIAEYGPTAYVVPPKEGFGLVAWVMPGAYLLGGTLLVVFVISRWRKRAVPAISGGTANSSVTPELLERARAAAQKATED